MKLVVAGCSVSDRTRVDTAYGEILADSIGYDYVHHGAGCGSNYRIWKKLTQMLMSGQLTENDIVLVQYTSIDRREFWSDTLAPEFQRYSMHDKNMELRELNNGGNIVRYKSFVYGEGKIENQFLKMYEKYFNNIEYNRELFATNHFLFHNTMDKYGIKIFYITFDNSDIHNLYAYVGQEQHLFQTTNEQHINITDIESKYCLEDKGHFSQQGHNYVAKVLEQKLKDRGVI